MSIIDYDYKEQNYNNALQQFINETQKNTENIKCEVGEIKAIRKRLENDFDVSLEDDYKDMIKECV